MASRKVVLPMIEKGWIKALLVVVIYSVLSILIGSLIPSLHLWILVTSVLAFLLVFFFRKFIDKRSFVSLGFKLSLIYPDGLIGILIGAALVCAGSVIIYLFSGFQWTDIFFDAKDLGIGIGSMLLVALAEELVYRGYVLRNLMKSFNKWIALVISTVLFALAHLSNPAIPMLGVVNILLGGVITGLAFIYSRNLWMSIGFHFSWNLFQGPLLGFPVSGFPFSSLVTMETDPSYPTISGGNFGFEGSIICTFLLLLLAGAAYSRIRKVQPSTAV